MSDVSTDPDCIGRDVCTRRATSLGTTGFTPNGAIQPRGRPGSYWFEIGETAAYGVRTEPRPLGPKLAAHYVETWDASAGGFSGGLGGGEFSWQPTGGAQGGHVRFSEPSGDDDNHVDGIGTIHLVDYLHVGTYLPEGYLNPRWGGGDPDLRDARVRVAVRNQDFLHATSELVPWIQSDRDLSLQATEGFVRANWAFTDAWLTDAAMMSGWQAQEYAFTNNSWAWSYAGQNLSQQRSSYQYWSLDEALGHANCDVFHVLAFVDPLVLPTGTIDLDEFELTYRNHSVLLPSNGATLVSAPADSSGVEALTDGWRNGPGRVWRSGPTPSTPLEISWRLAKPVRIQTVQVHQDPDFPSKAIEVLGSMDGVAWVPVASGVVPASAQGGANYAHFVAGGETSEEGIHFLDVDARFVKVRVLSGWQAARWGLGEVEVFGAGATYETEDDWYHVNTDFSGLAPGKSYHYRLVAEVDGKVTQGNDLVFTVPTGVAPEVFTGSVKVRRDGSTSLIGWVNPLGLATEWYFEFGESAFERQTPTTYAGLEQTPRLVTANLVDLTPGKVYRYRLVARRSTGNAVVGAESTFTAP